MEYYAYIPDKGWRIKELIKVVIVCATVAWIFYDKIWVAPFLFPLGIYVWKRDRRIFKEKRREIIRCEFQDFITLLSGSLNAGYSLEQSIVKAQEDMIREGSYKFITKEIALIINGLSLNKDVEELLLQMGERCRESIILEFAGLVATAKRYGGNINHLIQKTKTKLYDRGVIEREIDTLVSAKKLEGMIMLLMPFFIMVYMRFTNGEYIEQMYDSLMGRMVLTVSLVIVVVCGLVINKITEIEVL